MINLLPPEFKRGLYREKQFRLFIVLQIAVLMFFISLALSLSTISVYLKSELFALELQLEETKRVHGDKEQAIAEVEAFNDALAKLSRYYKENKPVSVFFELLSADLPLGSRLNSFVYTSSNLVRTKTEAKITPAKISITGFSQTREDLLSFKEMLEKIKTFSNLSFPSANWVMPKDISFSFQAEIK